MSFFKITDDKETRDLFKAYQEKVEEQLINVTQYFDFNPAVFNFRTDSTKLHKSLKDALDNVIIDLESIFGIGVKLCANSVYRAPFSMVNGKIDYNDLTALPCFTHYCGYSIDFEFSMMESKYKMDREKVKEVLNKNGFIQPFSWEKHHWSYTK